MTEVYLIATQLYTASHLDVPIYSRLTMSFFYGIIPLLVEIVPIVVFPFSDLKFVQILIRVNLIG